MREHLVGYLLNCLDEGTHRAVGTHLGKHAESRRELESLRQALAPLAADRGDAEPPRDLVQRTIARVAEYSTHAPVLPRAPRTPRTFAGDRSFRRRVDVLVAASLLLLVAGLTTLAVFQVRRASLVIACQENLREFHGGLEAYHRQHGHYPNVAAQPRAAAGMAVPILVRAGCLPRDANVRCPEIGPAAVCPLTLEELLTLPEAEFNRQAPRLVTCYAYDLGYREHGEYFAPRHPSQRAKAVVPLMADRPAADVRTGNSPNHGGLGQNVLFHDGHVVFLKVRVIGRDDFYLNNQKQVAAGYGPFDAVLGASDSKP